MPDPTLPMPNNEEGEFELILGNKQLLSVFFLVIVLLGVFFTIGYILGRNSSPVDAATRKPEQSDLNASSAGKSAMAPRVNQQPPAADTGKPLEVYPSPTSSAAEHSVSIPTPASQHAAKTSDVAEKPVKPSGKSLEVSAVSSGITIPEAGSTYVQVRALGREEAEVLAGVLTRKGLKAIVAPSPNEKIFRVLVGPVKDAAEYARLKGDLEQAGFKDAFRQKY
ncbi:MAG TPA: SPOR domain-containing protein [Bryobacteraceae bacterium]|nr:SPOR domain-containing protein [Bryobacteraceae bacterium]